MEKIRKRIEEFIEQCKTEEGVETYMELGEWAESYEPIEEFLNELREDFPDYCFVYTHPRLVYDAMEFSFDIVVSRIENGKVVSDVFLIQFGYEDVPMYA